MVRATRAMRSNERGEIALDRSVCQQIGCRRSERAVSPHVGGWNRGVRIVRGARVTRPLDPCLVRVRQATRDCEWALNVVERKVRPAILGDCDPGFGCNESGEKCRMA